MLHTNDTLLEERLLHSTHSDVDRAREAARHLILSGGKRVRPRLALLVAEAVGLDDEKAGAIGAAAELVHSATLLHDDVIDRSDTRRGKPTVNAKYGVGSAILTGDFLLAQALMILTEIELYPATREMSRAVRELAEAEILQLQQAFDAATPIEHTRRIAEGKTGALFSWCARAVALTAGSADEVCRAADRVGRLVGYAFQVADDLLDFAPDSASGKPGRKDLREGQVTMPMQLVRAADGAVDAAIHRAFETRDEQDYEAAYDLLAESDAAACGRSEIQRALSEAADALAVLTSDHSLGARFQEFVTLCTQRVQ